MRDQIQTILQHYEMGHVSRRDFVCGVAAILAAPTLLVARPPTSVFQARNLNHVTLATSDLARSRDFYQHILGLPVLKQDGDGLVLGAGKQFIGVDLASKAKEKVGIDHFCVGIDGFDADKARHSLATRSLETFTEFGSGVYFYDPDGNKVQVSAPDYQA
jgi:catechol 2,3-dioxygenase-like lactoylglutathione lyase family enzyme